MFAQPFVQAQIKKKSKPRVTGFCEGNSPVNGEFPTQRASNAEMFPFDDVIMYLFFTNINTWFSCGVTWKNGKFESGLNNLTGISLDMTSWEAIGDRPLLEKAKTTSMAVINSWYNKCD